MPNCTTPGPADSAAAPHRPIKLMDCDLNWALDSGGQVRPSRPEDWAEIDPQAYLDWHRDFGNNAMFLQAYAFGGYAFYPSRLCPVAPGRGAQLLPRFYDLARRGGFPFWSYCCVGQDIAVCGEHPEWLVPGPDGKPTAFLAPESGWTDLLCRRLEEFLRGYPVDWLLLDWFVYGDLRPDKFQIHPGPLLEGPFREVISRPLPATAAEITAEENLRYKREMLARQFRRIRDAVKGASPATRIMFNVPYWEPAEPLWVDHPMLNESDGLFAECTRTDVVEWLLAARRPAQRVMTTIIGRMEEGECDPHAWQQWHRRGCDFFGYAWGTPPDFRPHPRYDPGLKIVRAAFGAML